MTLCLKKAALQLGVSRSHLCRLFKRELGVGFPEYLRSVRATQARALLTETTLSIKEVSAAVGFRQTAQLDRAFRDRYGCTPTMFRARLAAGILRPAGTETR